MSQQLAATDQPLSAEAKFRDLDGLLQQMEVAESQLANLETELEEAKETVKEKREAVKSCRKDLVKIVQQLSGKRTLDLFRQAREESFPLFDQITEVAGGKADTQPATATGSVGASTPATEGNSIDMRLSVEVREDGSIRLKRLDRMLIVPRSAVQMLKSSGMSYRLESKDWYLKGDITEFNQQELDVVWHDLAVSPADLGEEEGEEIPLAAPKVTHIKSPRKPKSGRSIVEAQARGK